MKHNTDMLILQVSGALIPLTVSLHDPGVHVSFQPCLALLVRSRLLGGAGSRKFLPLPGIDPVPLRTTVGWFLLHSPPTHSPNICSGYPHLGCPCSGGESSARTGILAAHFAKLSDYILPCQSPSVRWEFLPVSLLHQGCGANPAQQSGSGAIWGLEAHMQLLQRLQKGICCGKIYSNAAK